MEEKKVKIKSILILVWMFILGFGVGMVFTFQIVFKRLEAHNLEGLL